MMKVILTPDMAKELLENEQMIKNQEGPYRPKFNTMTRMYEPVIKCWPLEEYKGGEIQQRDVIPGMENDVDDICMAKIDTDTKTISYKLNAWKWYPSFNPFTKVMDLPAVMKDYSILIYTPTFENQTIFLTGSTLYELKDEMKEYHIIPEKADEERKKQRMSVGVFFDAIDEWFQKYQGICTYILFKGDNVIKCGKFDNKKYW